MAAVTGPISSLPGTLYGAPDGTMCDDHPDRPATHRIQGETDSFGCEMNDYCDECYESYRAEIRAYAAEARCGKCDWCKKDATDLRDARDYDEGLCGPVYRVCGACIKRRNDEAAAELEQYDDYIDDWDDDDGYSLEDAIRDEQDLGPQPLIYVAGELDATPAAAAVNCKRCDQPWRPGHACRRRR